MKQICLVSAQEELAEDNQSTAALSLWAQAEKYKIYIASGLAATFITALIVFIVSTGSNESVPSANVLYMTKQCPLVCPDNSHNISVDNGLVFCGTEALTVQCVNGYEPQEPQELHCSTISTTIASLRCSLPACKVPANPKDGQTMCSSSQLTVGSSCSVQCDHGSTTGGKASVTCQEDLTWSSMPVCRPPLCSSTGRCKKTVMVLAGGERNGQVVDTVEVLDDSLDAYTYCLPNLPEAVKWGSLGFVAGALLVCGGEWHPYQSPACWVLDTSTTSWMRHSRLDNLRSQAASAVTADGESLVIIGGYADFEKEGYALPSIQRVGLQGTHPEEQLEVDSEPYYTRLAAAVSISSGDILITGGMHKERDVFLLSSAGLLKRCRSMKHGRFGHAATRLLVDQEEIVVVAGGFTRTQVASGRSEFEARAMVEMFSTSSMAWLQLPSLPHARVYFMLQVMQYKQS